MDPALKQRLVGAAVLVALAVIFVPMLLEAPEPESTPAGQLSLDVPARPDLALQTRDVPLTLPPPAADVPQAGSTAAETDPNAVATVDIDSAPRIDALDDGSAAPSAPAPAPAMPVPATPPAPTTPPPAAPRAQPAAPPAASEPVTAAPPKPVAPAPAQAPTPPAAASGRFVVNLGSYSNLDNAEALRKRLATRGYPLRSERIEVDGKPAQRLRAGPFRTRAEAEAAALKLNQSEPGARFTVGELDEAEPVAATASRVAQGFAVQLGAFKDESEAVALRDRVRKAGFAAYTERASTDAGTLWRVRAGPELQRDRAEALQARIRQALKLDGIVVAHP